ncbi:MAG: hypothetical protein WCK58_15975 [Chloroflexota bacterium]
MTASTIDELFRSLGLSLTIRGAADEEEAWACTLTRPDGKTYEIDTVAFFDVDPETGEEWIVEPTPTRVLGVLAGGADVEDEEGADGAEEADAAARDFLGDEAFELLQELYDAEE